MSDVVDRCEAYIAGNADGKRVERDRCVAILRAAAEHANVNTAQTLLRLARQIEDS